MKKRYFAVRCVNIWNPILAEAAASNTANTIKAQIDRVFGIGYRSFHNATEKKNNLSNISLEETQPAM